MPWLGDAKLVCKTAEAEDSLRAFAIALNLHTCIIGRAAASAAG